MKQLTLEDAIATAPTTTTECTRCQAEGSDIEADGLCPNCHILLEGDAYVPTAAAPTPRRSTWGGYILENRVEVGKVGPRWKQGGKIHRVFTQWIVGYADGFTPRPGHVKRGDLFRAYSPCNGNGQRIANPVAGWTDAMIDCGKCLKSL